MEDINISKSKLTVNKQSTIDALKSLLHNFLMQDSLLHNESMQIIRQETENKFNSKSTKL